jgi:hypothetical protein
MSGSATRPADNSTLPASQIKVNLRPCPADAAAPVIVGDALADFGQGLEINAVSLREGVTREQIAERLRPLLALPVEHVLATHGGPTDRAALERALSSS